MPQLDLSWYFLNFVLAWSFFLFFFFRCYKRTPSVMKVDSGKVLGKDNWENGLWLFF